MQHQHHLLHILLTLALLAPCLLAATTKPPGPANLIQFLINGQDLEKAEPYMASLRSISGTHECGGTLIHPRAVLTAAHCIKRLGSLDVDVGRFERVGLDEDSGFKSFKTTKVILHENYNPETYESDIALLVLDRAAAPPQIPLPMAESDSCFEDQQGCTVRLLGWGATSEGGVASRVLQDVYTESVRRSECQSLLRNVTITERMICAGEIEDGKYDSCQGDSGGPLILDRRLVGVVSFGIGCGRARSPGVYTSVPKMRSWIEAKLSLINFPVQSGSATVLVTPPVQPSPPPIPLPTVPRFSSPAPAQPSSPPVSLPTGLSPLPPRPLDPCDCAEDGISNGVQTNRFGCKQHLLSAGDTEFFCMTVGGLTCPRAQASKQFEEAAWILCG